MKFRYDKEKEKLILIEATRTEVHQLNLHLTRFAKGYRFTPQYKMRVWDGKERYIKDGVVNLGLWKECLKAASIIETNFVIENKEDFPINRDITLESVREWAQRFFKDHKYKKGNEWVPFMPYDYQIETAYKILKNRYCLAEVATSGGKSLIISLVYFYMMEHIKKDAKMLIIVPSISLVSQFYDNIQDFNLGFNLKYDGGNKHPFDLQVEEVMSDKPRKHGNSKHANLFIGTYQSLEKWPKDFFKQFDAVVVDESHKAKGTTIKKILERTFGHAHIRFGVSGTFPDDDTAEILNIQSVLGPKVTQIEASQLVEDGTITPMQVNAIILNHNLPHIHKRLKSAKTLNNGSEIYNVEKKYFQESEYRMNFLDKLIKTKCKDNTMVLFHNVDYGRRIYERLKENPDIDVYYIDGEVNNKEREEIIAEMNRTDRVKVLVSSYGTTATGLSINSIFNVVFADSFKSESLVIQAIGRALRKFNGKDLAMIYDLVDIFDPNDMSNSIYKHFLEREKFYKKRKYPYKVFKVNINTND